jgi:septum site-determining protein MinD
MAQVLGIISLKGGVGKTEVVAELGSAIASFGKKVLLIDGNLTAPNLGLRFNIVNPEKTLHHLLSKKAKPEEVIEKISNNLDLIPASIIYNYEVNPIKLKEVIQELRRKYDYILIDSSPSLDNTTLSVMIASDKIFVVSTPDHITLGTTIKAINQAKKRGTPIAGLILNKVHNKNFELNTHQIEEVLEVPVMALIDYHTNIQKATSKFKPIIYTNPHSNQTKEFRKLAATLTGKKEKKNFFRKFLKFTPKKHEINREIYYKRTFN